MRFLPRSRLVFVALFLDVIQYAGQSYAQKSFAQTSFLSDTLVRKDQVQNVLEHQPAKHTSCENADLTGPIETTLCDYETIESVNDELFRDLSDLVRMPFFRYFQVDLYRECPFWAEHGSCNNPGCAITTVDESDIPERWRAAALSKVDPASIDKRHELPGCYYRDSDYCFLDDNTGKLRSKVACYQRYTGYSGHSARRVWRSIYEENCFGLSELSLMTGKSPAPVTLPDTMIEALHDDGTDSPAHCLEKRVYYKVISGLHASISTHICHEYLNQTTGEWGPNLNCFIDRVASHPERLQYIYFNTILLLRAAHRLGPYLSAFDYCSTGKHEDDAETWGHLAKVLQIAKDAGKFDETVLFRGENANVLKEEFKTHFRNVTRIMDCVGCDKCRLWGKVQTTGLATALKILFELEEKALNPKTNPDLLHRSEVVALFNTLFRFSESLKAVDDFRQEWRQLDKAESERIITETEKSTRARPKPSPRVDEPHPTTPLLTARLWFFSFFRVCKESTAGCFGEQNECHVATNCYAECQIGKEAGNKRSSSTSPLSFLLPVKRAPLFPAPPLQAFANVLGIMIIPAEDHEKQDLYTGPTLRLPDRVARRRRSFSTLPDYEASQAQYRGTPVPEAKKTRPWHQTKLWRAILFLLLTYTLLTTVIGVPIIVKKMREGPGPPPPWNSDDFFTNRPQFSSGSMITYEGNHPCNAWSVMDYVSSPRPYTATLQRQIPATGNVSIRSNATIDNTFPTNVLGSFTAEYDSTITDNNVHMSITLQTTSKALQDRTLVCYDDIGEDRGLAIFIPSNIRGTDSISMDIHVAFPPYAATGRIANFNVYLPVFTQTFSDLSQINFQSVYIEGGNRPINVTNIQAPCISVKSTLGDISGTYNASESLVLDTIRGNINASITLVKAVDHTPPTQMSLDTGDCEINAKVNLVAPGKFTTSPLFAGKVNNFNAEVNLAISTDSSTSPIPIYFTVQNNLAKTTVVTDQKYLGTFLAQTKLNNVSVKEGPENRKLDALYGSGRSRTVVFDQPMSDARSSGWVGWGKRPNPITGQSYLEITSSLGPVELEFGLS
ncbi:hypothetical protein NP233_g5439 [Leucocoprinus birnbaumii]|uniref:Uncharacterized protein n=1 Tax=Leucocoprinus birnbaumii TaxID=56174 RepID=A0AAD5YWG3_9AGAR|nr:hypothetical protein NP233_g5439 [Leucocoprinus birnbaumii]